jgi:hypothetical protein
MCLAAGGAIFVVPHLRLRVTLAGPGRHHHHHHHQITKSSHSINAISWPRQCHDL